jgi:biopolymer transport protein ExbB/TolQ
VAGWIWAIIWVSLGVGALVVWSLIFASMVPSSKAIARQVKKLAPAVKKLNQALQEERLIEHPQDNMSDSPELLQAERDALLERRRKRKERRARSLVARVKHIKLEGRFKDVR